MNLKDLYKDEEFLREVFGLENDLQFVIMVIEPEYDPNHHPLIVFDKIPKVKTHRLPIVKELSKI